MRVLLLLRRLRRCSSDRAGLQGGAVSVLADCWCCSYTFLLLDACVASAGLSQAPLSSVCACPAAFDKDDLLYLRDKEQEQRHQEQHTRDAEAAAFAAARAAAEAQAEAQAAKLLRQQQQQQQQAEATRCGLDSSLQECLLVRQSSPQLTDRCGALLMLGAVNAHVVGCRPHSKARPTPLLSVVRPVKPQQHQQQVPEGEHRSQPPAAIQQQQQQQLVDPHPAKRQRVEAEPASAGPQQPALSQHSAQRCTAEAPLQNLLGGYGSEGESDEDAQQPGQTSLHAAHTVPKTKLPSAEELLESELTSSVGGGGGAHPPSDAVEAAVLVHCGVRRGLQPQQQGSWV
jgi:hypothetical protein